jgi:hypothetical protein
MRSLFVALAVLFATTGSAGAQCCGDCNGDGRVSISDLVTAVNNALDNCGAATSTPTPQPTVTPTPPNRCPSTFTDNQGACLFSGHFNQGCGAALPSTFTSNGSALVVSIDTLVQPQSTVRFAAVVDSAATAHLTAWSSNDFQTTHPIAGQVQLNSNGQLVVFPNDSPFMILGCNFVRYLGDFVGTSGRDRLQSSAAENDAALQRLQAWMQRPVPELSEQGEP